MFWVARPPRRSALALDCEWTIGSSLRVARRYELDKYDQNHERPASNALAWRP